MHVLKTDFRKNWGLEKLGKNMMCVKNVFFFLTQTFLILSFYLMILKVSPFPISSSGMCNTPGPSFNLAKIDYSTL